MNAEDQEYYTYVEINKGLAELDAQLRALREKGVREPIQGDAGSVAVNAFGVVLAVELDQHHIKYLNKDWLANYIVTAVATAQKQARRRHEELLNNREV